MTYPLREKREARGRPDETLRKAPETAAHKCARQEVRVMTGKEATRDLKKSQREQRQGSGKAKSGGASKKGGVQKLTNDEQGQQGSRPGHTKRYKEH